MAYEIKGKVCVVTGGASGIGRSLCLSLANEGAKAVVIADINQAGGQETIKLGSSDNAVTKFDYVSCDCSKETDIENVILKTTEKFGSVDIFVGNAGIGTTGDLVENYNEAQFMRMFHINVMQHIWAAKVLVPRWREEKTNGCMIVTASAAGLLMQIGSLSYAVTKRAAVSVAEFLSITYGHEGLNVVCVCPQAVRTPMIAGTDGGVAAVDGMLEADDVALETIKAVKEGRFLVSMPDTVDEYMRRKAGDYNRWIKGMQRLNARFMGKSKM